MHKFSPGSCLQDAVGEVLEVVVELGGEAVDALLHHAVHLPVQLVLGQVQVKPAGWFILW